MHETAFFRTKSSNNILEMYFILRIYQKFWNLTMTIVNRNIVNLEIFISAALK